MRLTVVQDGSEDIHTVEIGMERTVRDLKGMLETRTGVPISRQRIICNGSTPSDESTIGSSSMSESDMIALTVVPNTAQQQRSAPKAPQQASAGPSASGSPNWSGMAEQFQLRRQAEALRKQALADPNVMARLREQAPPLAEATNNSAQFAQMFLEAQRQQQAQQRELAELDDDENQTAEKQEKILEILNQRRVLENRSAAIEDYPEAFGSVTMLYVPVTVNGHKVKAFVDSGAQTTIISPECAERCGIKSLIDKAFGGVARGVGTSRILGRIHLTELVCADTHLMCSFSVIEGTNIDMLLGLDMLKRHQASIDLEKNVLRIAGKEVAFLPESEIPQAYADPDEPEIEGPGGLKVGARTGTIKPVGGSGEGASTAGAASSTSASQKQRENLVESSKAEEFAGKVKQLQEITGCSETEATNALKICNDDVDTAANMLLN